MATRRQFLRSIFLEGTQMIADHLELESLSDAKLARTHPEAYEQLRQARRESNPFTVLMDFLKRLFKKN